MDINRNNYEGYLLDLTEGRLTAEETQQVRDFLLLNPDCDEGFIGEQTWNLSSGAIVFKGKKGLKKSFPDPLTTLTPSNFDLFSIARLEGDLTPEQKADHDRLMAEDVSRKREWEAWQQTRLAGETILYGRKDQLIKAPVRRTRMIWISVISTAAVLAMVITLIRINPDLTGPAGNSREVVVEIMDDPRAFEEEGKTNQQESSLNPVTLASEPATLSIKKHQDPPELTGENQDPVQTSLSSDSSSRIVDEEKIQTRPLKLGMMSSYPKTIGAGPYDRIVSLDLPPFSNQSGSLTWTQLSEKGLRQTYKDFMKEKDLSLLTIASAGVEGINRLTGSEFSLNLSRDESGEVSGFRFHTSRMSVASPVGKTE
ncbi:MAG: hypothetical protein V2B15_18820 [Bacteroidota bacterium]